MNLKCKLKYTSETDQELKYAHNGDAGIDLAIKKSVILPGFGAQKVGTGIAVEIPKGYFGLLVPRSSMGGIRIGLANTVGVIDHEYRGEIQVFLENKVKDARSLDKGARVAQLIILPFATAKLVKVEELKDSVRGKKGWGSTGHK